MGVLFDTVKRLYDEGKLTEIGVTNAVAKGWITADDKLLIIPVVEEIPNEIIQDEL